MTPERALELIRAEATEFYSQIRVNRRGDHQHASGIVMPRYCTRCAIDKHVARILDITENYNA